MSPRAEVRAILEQAASKLESEGFQVYLEPTKDILPEFLRRHAPDAIALSNSSSTRNLVIEIASAGSQAAPKQEALREALKDHKDWELKLFFVNPLKPSPILPIVAYGDIVRGITTVESLLANGQIEPALLMAWASFEALCRASLPAEFAKPQSPGRLVEVLARLGTLTPSQADLARSLAGQRNAIIHGVLTTKVDPLEVQAFVDVLRNVLSEAPIEATPEASM
jgi:uncharacterized protein YutE (UPF0331/DUF86 family)